MVIIILILILGMLFIPFKLKVILHNNKIKVYLIILNFIKFKVFERNKLVSFEEDYVKKLKSHKFYKIVENDFRKEKSYFKNMKFLKLVKKIAKKLEISINICFKFGFERRDITAILYGFLCALLPVLKGFLCRVNSNFNLEFKLYPNFNIASIDFKVISTFKTTLFKMILIIFIVFQEILLIKKNKI
ncbi:DUF2953 domain-containing protein [Clostridium cylindrosporum]|uniref:DUF2953 domain-containing protein n=1 Tax=Clostridium cylindrosporum DSM 605 TaxID=1121307 RepID=A0A0J8D693_CLOCY|nr:DUF2953 domain-containing protein [Clostridium cylindrosporum]KMT21372.1 hypothetical protein CLCY_2c01320 [Clostridium cylindrosporum DSM 605]